MEEPRTPNSDILRDYVVPFLVPKRVKQLSTDSHPDILREVYERADREELGVGVGASLDFAYLLAVVWCSRSFTLEAYPDLGDVWCTGRIDFEADKPRLSSQIDIKAFDLKLEGFLEQTQGGDRLFFVPRGIFKKSHSDRCRSHDVQVLPLKAFLDDRARVLRTGELPVSTVILVDHDQLQTLVDTLFEPRRPYKFLEAFGPEDKELFCGRDQDSEQLWQKVTTNRLMILYGASGTGKTSLLQAGLLPRLLDKLYAWVFVRMVDDKPTAAIKAALIRECGVDARLLDQSLLNVARVATDAIGRTVVLILDQFENFFRYHDLPVRQRLYEELRECMSDNDVSLHVVIALREDYLAQLNMFEAEEDIQNIMSNRMRLTYLARTRLERPSWNRPGG